MAVRQYLLLANPNLPNLELLISRMRAANVQRRARHNPLLCLTVPEEHQLATAAVWPAWNTVEGPRRRSDDPRDRYFDRFTSGLTDQEAHRMTMIEMLFHQLQAFADAGEQPGPANLRALSQFISPRRPLYACAGPIRYRPVMWVQDGNGNWSKRRDGVRYVA